MRIRGINDETGELMPKLDGLIKQLTGVDIMKDKNTFKSTYDIMLEISKVWKSLPDTSKATLLEQLFGKHQGAVGASLLNNMADGVKATETAINSLGSSVREQARYMESITAHINAFNESLTKLKANSLNSELIKFVVDFGTGIVNLVDKIGLLSTAIGGLIVYFTFFKTKMVFTPIINAATVAIAGFTKSLGIAGIAAIRLNTILGMFAPLAIAAGIYALIKAFDYFNVSIDEQREKVQTLSDELHKLQSEYDQLLTKENRTAQEEKYLAILEAQIEAQKKLLADETKRLVNRQYLTSNDTGSGVLGGSVSNSIKEATYGVGKTGDINKAIADLQRYNEELLNLDANSKDAIKRKDELNKLIADSVDFLSEEYKSIQKNIQILEKTNEQHSEEYQILVTNAKAIEEVIQKYNELGDSANKAGDSIKKALTLDEAIKLLKNAKEETKDLNSALEEYRENGKFSGDTLLELIENHKDLIPYLGDEAKLYEEISKKVKEKTLSLQDSFNTELNDLETSINKKLEGYVTDLENWRNIEEAKLKISQDMLNQVDDLYRKTLTATGDEGTAEITAMKFARRLKEKLQATLPDIENYINLKSFDVGKILSSDSKTSSTRSSKASDVSPTLIEADRYASLNSELERTNVLLAKNKALQENVDDEKRIELLKEEQELLKQKQANLYAINEERRKERDELVKNLQQQGVLFEGQGDLINAKNAELILQEKINEVNAHRNDKDKTYYNKLKEEYDKLNNELKRFIELQTKDIPDASVEWWNLQKAIRQSGEEINKTFEGTVKDLVELEKKLDKIELDKKEKKLKSDIEDLEKSIYGTTQKEWEAEHNNLIDSYEQQIEALEREADLEDEIAERQKRQLEIQELQNKLENLKSQKTVQTLKQQSDGSWQFEYTYDQQAVEDVQNEIEKKKEEFNEWEADTQRKHEIQRLRDQIEAERRMIEAKRTSYETQKANLELAFQKEKEIYDLKYQDINTIVQIRMEEIKTTHNGKLDEMIEDANDRLRRLKEKYQKALDLQTKLENMTNDDSSNSSTPAVVRDTGGILPHGVTAINLSGKDEMVLNPEQTKTWIKLVNNLPNIMKTVDIDHSLVNGKIPNLNTHSNNVSQVFNISKLEFPNITNPDGLVDAIKSLPYMVKQQSSLIYEG